MSYMLQMSFFLLAISILDAIITTDDNNVNIELCYIREDLACEFISFRDNLLILTRVFCLPSRPGYWNQQIR